MSRTLQSPELAFIDMLPVNFSSPYMTLLIYENVAILNEYNWASIGFVQPVTEILIVVPAGV